jgi:uncharacterized protein
MKRTYALITGASSGIGKAIAEELARRGSNLLLIALPDSGLPEVAKNIRQEHGVLTRYLETDLTKEHSVLDISSWLADNQFALSILVNNAGFGNYESFEGTDPQLLSNMLLLNNLALVKMTQICLPILKRQGKSYILNVGSLASFLPIPNKVVYAASKSFVYAFSSALRLEVKPANVVVSCLCPGGTLTNASAAKNIQAIGKQNSIFIQMPVDVAKEGISEMLNEKKRIIPGWKNKFIFMLYEMLPETFIELIVEKIFAASRNLPHGRNFCGVSTLALMNR